MRKVRASAVIVGAALLMSGHGAAVAAQAAEPAQDAIEVCEGNTLSTTDATGTALPARQLSLAEAAVGHLCDQGVTTQKQFAERAQASTTAADVRMNIYTAPAIIEFSGQAVGVPYNKRTRTPFNELQCIYRQQDTGGPAVAWKSCGYGTGTTSVTTSTLGFCPPEGKVYQGYATLFANGREIGEDYAIAVSL